MAVMILSTAAAVIVVSVQTVRSNSQLATTSPYGWYSAELGAFFQPVVNDLKTWSDANSWCSTAQLSSVSWNGTEIAVSLEDGRLASLTTANLVDSTTSQLRLWQIPSVGLWVGGRRQYTPWTWSNGLSIGSFAPWDSSIGSPTSGRSTADCAALQTSSETWAARDCTSKLPFICRTSSPKSPKCAATQYCGAIPATEDVPICFLVCWSTPGGVTSGVTWYTASDWCRQSDSELVSLSIQDLQDFTMVGLRRLPNKSPEYWIGLKRNSNWTWAVGGAEILPTYWTGQDSNLPTGDCLSLNVYDDSATSGGSWQAINCNTTQDFICQYPATLVLPTTTMKTTWTWPLATTRHGGLTGHTVSLSPQSLQSATTPAQLVGQRPTTSTATALSIGLSVALPISVVALALTVCLCFVALRRRSAIRRNRAENEISNAASRNRTPAANGSNGGSKSDVAAVSETNRVIARNYQNRQPNDDVPIGILRPNGDASEFKSPDVELRTADDNDVKQHVEQDFAKQQQQQNDEPPVSDQAIESLEQRVFTAVAPMSAAVSGGSFTDASSRRKTSLGEKRDSSSAIDVRTLSNSHRAEEGAHNRRNRDLAKRTDGDGKGRRRSASSSTSRHAERPSTGSRGSMRQLRPNDRSASKETAVDRHAKTGPVSDDISAADRRSLTSNIVDRPPRRQNVEQRPHLQPHTVDKNAASTHLSETEQQHSDEKRSSRRRLAAATGSRRPRSSSMHQPTTNAGESDVNDSLEQQRHNQLLHMMALYYADSAMEAVQAQAHTHARVIGVQRSVDEDSAEEPETEIKDSKLVRGKKKDHDRPATLVASSNGTDYSETIPAGLPLSDEVVHATADNAGDTWADRGYVEVGDNDVDTNDALRRQPKQSSLRQKRRVSAWEAVDSDKVHVDDDQKQSSNSEVKPPVRPDTSKRSGNNDERHRRRLNQHKITSFDDSDGNRTQVANESRDLTINSDRRNRQAWKVDGRKRHSSLESHRQQSEGDVEFLNDVGDENFDMGSLYIQRII